MTSKLTRLTDDELAETLRLATSGYPISASTEANLRHAFAELQERRKADSEPVAWTWQYREQWHVTSDPRRAEYVAKDGDVAVLPLYRHAQQPVVPENCVTAEHRRVIEMLLNVCGAAFELADDSCQQDVDGEDCHVVPDYAFQKLSDALDEIENTLPTEDIDRPDVFLAWSAMPRAALKSILQSGNSPLIPVAEQRIADAVELLKQAAPAILADNSSPDGPLVGRLKSPVIGIDPASGPDHSVEVRYVAPPGYVMVPKEPTETMINAWLSEVANWRGHVAGYKAMLAAAPQEEK